MAPMELPMVEATALDVLWGGEWSPGKIYHFQAGSTRIAKITWFQVGSAYVVGRCVIVYVCVCVCVSSVCVEFFLAEKMCFLFEVSLKGLVYVCAIYIYIYICPPYKHHQKNRWRFNHLFFVHPIE